MQSNSTKLDASNRQFTAVNEQNNLPPPLDGHIIVNNGTIVGNNNGTINGNISSNTTPGNRHTLHEIWGLNNPNNGKISCDICHKPISPVWNTIFRHCISKFHVEKSDKIASRHGDGISLGLRQNLIEAYMLNRGISVDKATTVAKICNAFLATGVAFNNLSEPDNPLRVVLEEALCTKLTRSMVSKMIPLCKENELQNVKYEISQASQNSVSIIFDGTTDGPEILVFVIRFLMNDVICHRLCQLNLFK